VAHNSFILWCVNDRVPSTQDSPPLPQYAMAQAVATKLNWPDRKRLTYML
jgi:hypothetical protein